MSYDVYGIGNAIMDIQVQCSDAFLSDNGIEKGLMTLTEPEDQKKILKALAGHDINYCSGGSAANTIVGIADMGGHVAYAGKTGRDAYGRRYLEEMEKLGVDLESQPVEGDTGNCVVLITPDAQRTMLTHLGASVQLSEADINEDKIRASRFIYVEGYLFAGDSTKAAAFRAIELAKKHNVKVALTVSDPFIADIAGNELKHLMESSIDLLFCNEIEAKALTGCDDVIEAAEALHKQCKNVAMTLGSNGSIIMHEGEAIAIESVEVEAIDTTGAGDMYAAGVLHGITHGLDWKHSGHLGSHAAAQIVSQLGARLPKRYSHQDIEDLLK